MPLRSLTEVVSLPPFVSQQVTSARRFYLNLKPRAARELTVVCGGTEECALDYVVARETFPYCTIEFVAAGRGEVTLGGRTRALSAGTLFAYAPGVPHTIRTAREAPLVKYFVNFIGAPSRRRMKNCGLEPGGCLQIAAIGDVRSAFDALIRLGLWRDPHTERTCALQLELLLYTIARAARGAGSASERRSRATFERCREHIDTYFLSLHSVGQIAAACHVNTSHVCRLFRRFHHESPLHYLQRQRMQWAAERLHSSGALVREVADELRVDPFQFSRTFKRVHGVPPMAFLGTRV